MRRPCGVQLSTVAFFSEGAGMLVDLVQRDVVVLKNQPRENQVACWMSDIC